ncbi:hypothetical protein [Citrobacter pasteurii]|nr:hypothetical protein [Citrobacter pasteurii]
MRSEFDNPLSLIRINDMVYLVPVHEHIATPTAITGIMDARIDDVSHVTPSPALFGTD